MTQSPATDALPSIAVEIQQLRDALGAAEAEWAAGIGAVDPRNQSSAVNLAHYWAVRQQDVRDLQRRLAEFGLSSLGRSEPHVQATLNAIAAAVGTLVEHGVAADSAAVGIDEGQRLLRRRTADLFGAQPPRRPTRIMVTLPSEAARDYDFVRDLLDRGMDVARINCAHDGANAWASMVDNVRKASEETGRPCRIAMDLAGPKLRTGPLAGGPGIVRLRPRHDASGRLVEPARCHLVAAEAAGHARATDIPVAGDWLARRRAGDTIIFHDQQGASRSLRVQSVKDADAVLTCDDFTYIGSGTILDAPDGSTTTVGELPERGQFLRLSVGDQLLLTRDNSPAPVIEGETPRIGCSMPEVFGNVRKGQTVRLDDGKISGRVLAADKEQISVEITHAAIGGTKLRAEKGINLPDTVLPVSALTAADRSNLRFVAEQAHMVQLSFVRAPADVTDLLDALADLHDSRLGIVLKIETVQGFQNLPEILLTALRRRRVGVMIARGDLAVECGYERLAELQEEILWLCEAAHVPVIWATQVLDQMARAGQPSRAEVTDAAMGVRAECVMLNKGPHILDAVTVLDDILRRMSAHQSKKTALMRPLLSWQRTD